MHCVWRSIFSKCSYLSEFAPISSKLADSYFKQINIYFPKPDKSFNSFIANSSVNFFFKRPFSTSNDNPIDYQESSSKLFKELENENFHHYMSKNVNYQSTIHMYRVGDPEVVCKDEFERIISVEKWNDRSLEDFHSSFLKASQYASKILHVPISNPMFTALSLGMKEHCDRFSDQQLIEVLECLRFWPETGGVYAPNFRTVIQTLDSVCLFRRNKWNVETNLRIIDLWFGLRLTRLSTYVKKCIDRIIEKPKRLSVYNMVQIFFYLNTMRSLPADRSLFEMEFQLEKSIEKLTLSELAIIASGYFKTQKKIASKTLLNKILLKLLEDMDNVDFITLAALLKLTRYSGREHNYPMVLEILDKLIPKMNHFSLQTNLHILLLCVEGHIDNYDCVSNFMKIVLENPREARLKEMEKLACALNKFKYRTELVEMVCQTMLSELKEPRRREELVSHGRSFIRCVCNLSLLGFLDHELISTVLNKRFLNEFYSNKYITELDVAALDQTIELEIPDYKGCRLDPKTMNFICRNYSILDLSMKFRAKKEVRMILEIMSSIARICKPNSHTTKYILPHYARPDVILNVTDDMKFLAIPDVIMNRENFTGIMKCPTGLRLCALVGGTKAMFTYGTNVLLGEHRKKIQQLELIGYIPILVPYYEWNNLNDDSKKTDYIYKKIETAFKDNSSCVKKCENKI